MTFDKFKSRQGIEKNTAPELSRGWELKKLGELFDVQSSKRVHKKDWKETGIPFYRAREVVKLAKNGFVQNELFISEDLFNEFTKEKGAPKADDIIISAVGTLGQCYLVREADKFYIKDASVLWFSKKSQVDSRYIEYSFKAPIIQEQVLDRSMGATVGTLTITRAKEIEIPVPPLPEQQRIVSILNHAFAAIDQAKANYERCLSLSKGLFESFLQGVFENGDWEWKTLNEISENLDSKRIPITKNKRTTGDIPYYGASGIVDYVADFIFDEDLLCISEDGANLLARTYPIAFSISGKTWVNNHAHILRFKTLTTQKFIEYYINSIRVDDYVSGMAQPKLNQKNLNRIPVPFPPLEEQETILSRINQLRAETQKLENIYQKKIDALEELKKSILQKAFQGELKTDTSANSVADVTNLKKVEQM